MKRTPLERFFDLFVNRSPQKIYDGSPPPSDEIREETIVDGFVDRLDQHELWVTPRVNLWELNSEQTGMWKPEEIVGHYGHPLQPDIDLLFGPVDGSRRTGPLVGVEVKHFAYQSGAGNVLPKTRLATVPDENGGQEWQAEGGFYAGLDQALALLQTGVDYVILAHIIHYDPDIWELPHSNNTEDKRAAYREISKTYSRNIARLIDTFDLPIGYVAAGAEPLTDAIASHTIRKRSPDRNPFVRAESAGRIRALLSEGLDLDIEY
ncbi:hypothetical protein GRX03_15615 [Halovenus sp. WSH3]|uniref:Uncharacterized protein n=1 Tax=Halovenus carboxidivorans TaxID=2692199 RepID=A0A6B0T9V5_9EURY|nr:hypothetical protein [Halovenus carboxidivorans]MXR53026.1 hypothetical protein [Halovenus carboxidivorans]